MRLLSLASSDGLSPNQGHLQSRISGSIEHHIPGRYVLLPVTADKLATALQGLPVLGFRGCNVTMPHKQSVIPLLDASIPWPSALARSTPSWSSPTAR